MALCLAILPSCGASSPPKPFSAEVSPSDPIAEVVEIKNRPVWVKFLNTNTEASANVGTLLKVGETIRTEANARTQILFKSGVVVRIEGESTLTLNPKNQLELSRGKMIARIGGEKNVTVQIKTPVAMAAISDSTVYVEIPKDAGQDRHIFALQGGVEVKLNGSTEAIALKTGQDLAIKSSGVAASPKNLDPQAIEKRFAQNSLLYGFNTKLDSQASIEQDLKISNQAKESEKIPYTRSEKSTRPAESAANTGNSRVEERSPTYEAPPQPVQEDRPRNTTPVNSAPPVANPTKSVPPPVPTQAVAEPPPLPVQPETTAEPPPIPVQPDAGNTNAPPVPVPSSGKPPKP